MIEQATHFATTQFHALTHLLGIEGTFAAILLIPLIVLTGVVFWCIVKLTKY